jgi:tetratricopeptide (TPR) repeat protein
VGFTNEGSPYLVSEYEPGGSLRGRLKSLAGQPLPHQEAMRLLTQIGQALEYAHQQNVIHQDIKPENILFNEQGDALLSDFGIAIKLNTTSVMLSNPSGTPAYMAPEQFKGTASKEGDQYALGCLAYELFTGRRVFDAPTPPGLALQHATEPPTPPTRYNSRLPYNIEQAILRALSKERSARFPGISAFLQALSGMSTEVSSLPPTTPSLLSQPENWLSEGEAHLRLNRPEKALVIFEQILQFAPSNVAALVGKSKSLAVLERFEEALQTIQEAVRLEPRNPSHLTVHEEILALRRRKQESQRPERQTSKSALEWYDQGNTLYQQKHYEQALKAFGEAVRLDQNNANYQSGWGRALYSMKHYKEALAVFQKVARQEPKVAYYARMEGEIRCELKQYQEALQAFERGAQLAPKEAYYPKMQGEVLCNLKKFAEALPMFERATRLEPNNAGLIKRQEEIKSIIRQQEQERSRVQPPTSNNSTSASKKKKKQQKKESPPATPPVTNAALEQYNQGNTFYKTQQYEKALLAFDKAVSLEPDNAKYQSARGQALFHLKRYQDAVGSFEAATRLAPETAEYARWQGEVLYELKLYQEALQAFERGIQLAPDKAAYSYYMRGEIFSELKQFENAELAFAKATQLEPGNFSYVKKLEQVRAQLKSKEKEPTPPKTPAQPSGNAQTHYNQGMTHYKNKRYKQALQAFDQAVGLAPNNSTYQCWRGRALAGLQRYQEALLTFDEAIRLQSKNQDAYYRKAEVLKTLGKNKEAEQTVAQAAQQQNNSNKKGAAQNNGNKKSTAQNNGGPPGTGQNNSSQNQETPFQRFIKRLLS